MVVSMKKTGKATFWIVAALTIVFTYVSFLGISIRTRLTKTLIKGGNDIRWGIDIRGGVDVTFTPPEGVDATDKEMAAAQSSSKRVW